MRRPIPALLFLVLFLLAGGAVVGALIDALVHLDLQRLRLLGDRAWVVIPAAALLYLGAHALRAVRLALIIDDDRVSLRKIAAAHMLAAGAGLLIPFKLGEVYRIIEIDRLLRAPVRAVLVVWTERVLDLLTITALVLVGLWTRQGLLHEFAAGIAVTLGVVVGTFVLFFVIPENIESLKLYIIRRYNSPGALRVLRVLHGAHLVITQAPGVLKRRLSTLVSLGVAIWALEIAALGLFLPAAVDWLRAGMVSAAFIFSRLLPASDGSLIAIARKIQPDLHVEDSAAALAAAYPGAVYLPLLALAAVVFLVALRGRWREFALARSVPGRVAVAPERIDYSRGPTEEASGNGLSAGGLR